MTIFLTLILFLVSTTGYGGSQIADGLYLISRNDASTILENQNGPFISLGERRKIKIEESAIISLNNANDKFYARLTFPFDESIHEAVHVLVVEGTAYQQHGAGSQKDVTSTLLFDIMGNEKACQVAAFLNTPIFYRKHPQHNLLVSFVPAKKEFSTYEQVNVTLQIQNLGTHPIMFMDGGLNRGLRDNQYVFSAHLDGQPVADIGTYGHSGGLAFRRVLKPGELFKSPVNLNDWFEFGAPGSYVVQGSYYLNFIDYGSDSSETIWEDYVSAGFYVRIK
jgi:hypothetical protein